MGHNQYVVFLSSYGQTGTGKTFTMEGEKSSEGGSWDEVCAAHLFLLIMSYAKLLFY